MGAMYFHGIKTDRMSITSALGKGRYHFVDISGGHRVTVDLPRDIHTGGGVPIDVALG